ncbi:class I SAM-dependent methyltransferase [Rhodococcus pyridinivorans]|uniref:class I SAM-dependent methyltransferase n=1 Tax=Rhodococcus pyridinivorans TaxID=103816 RepID=UPI00200A77BE|nr:class I SAM-dependent methyltransferase [Rhodococcus pyridinivorans]UPW03666.1 class I SAM-dependent methyltransferase [Rhodococcus pyridinivorans]WMM73732.1 class I SAM-dependent methyltransferase [Rhodococcus pyridinivorans]
MKCRLCNSDRLTSILDLGATPPCERFLTAEQLDLPECTYPLHLRLCEDCLLLQIPALITPEDTFTEYAYYSSYSQSWVDHARRFVHDALGSGRLRPDSTLVEVASNDGYLLRHAVDAGIRCLGIEPSVNVGEAARAAGVPTHTGFLDVELAESIRSEHGPADLVVANNVYAHVPDLVGFTRALRLLMADDGWLSIEVHHALNLVALGQFDTIYHEHFQYYTVLSAARALASGGLRVVDVELLDTHGGSIRVWARPEQVAQNRTPRVAEVIEIERRAGLHDPTGYFRLEPLARTSRLELLRFLLQCREDGLSVVGYGAPGKGNTLLNYCGIRPDLLSYTVDRNPYKHGRFTPGTRIPIEPVERIAQDRPDIVLALPWNLEPELTRQLAYIADWGGHLVFPLPTIHTAIGEPELSWRTTS